MTELNVGNEGQVVRSLEGLVGLGQVEHIGVNARPQVLHQTTPWLLLVVIFALSACSQFHPYEHSSILGRLGAVGGAEYGHVDPRRGRQLGRPAP